MQNDINNQNILPVGTTLKNGQYRIVRHLKSGGFGNTYVVEDTSFHECSAMKEFFIHAKGVNTRSGMTVTVSNPVNEDDFLLYKRKFIHEIQRLRELHNRHVVRIYDDFEENNTAYYVMEFIDGESLTDRLSRTGRAMTEAEVTDVLRQVLNALTEVHGKGFVHADITPNNIMIDKSGNVVLIDFGSTKEVEEGNHRSTLAAMTRTPDYTPQEQLDGDVSRMGPWSDFYSLGVTLFRLLTLESPLELKDKEEEAFAPYQDHIRQPMRELILWMTKPNRRKRPQSVAEILAFVKENFKGRPSETHKQDEPTLAEEKKETKDEKTELEKKTDAKDKTEFEEKKTAVDKKVSPKPKPSPASMPQPKVRSLNWMWIVGAVAFVALVVGLLWTANSGQSSQDGDKASLDGEQTNNYTELPAEQKAIIQNLINNMVPVEGGTFMMGATPEQGNYNYVEDAKPAHKVTLPSFFIGKYEVTQEEWEAVMDGNPSSHKSAKLPVEFVNWYDSQEFIRKLNQMTGKHFRLPTEAEWEYAARGGIRSRGYKYAGSDNLNDVAWYSVNSDLETHPVGQKKPNELGLYDMSGNVYEWCQDWYGDYSSSSQTNPSGQDSGSFRVYRSSCCRIVEDCRVWVRGRIEPGRRLNDLGLRLAL